MNVDSRLLAKAQRHLARRDAVLKRLISRVGPCTLTVNPDCFTLLARAILSQQISTKAADSISQRLLKLLAPHPLAPRSILKHSEEKLRSAGLSTAKSRYLLDLAHRVHNGTVELTGFETRNDEEIIELLTQVKGIGTWTAQMFLIFSLGRLDVLPVDDLGLRAGVRQEYRLDELPDRKAVTQMAEPWKPYRSIATWYFWRSRGPVPQSK